MRIPAMECLVPARLLHIPLGRECPACRHSPGERGAYEHASIVFEALASGLPVLVAGAGRMADSAHRETGRRRVFHAKPRGALIP